MEVSLRIRVNLAAAAVVAGLAVVYSFAPTAHSFYPACPVWTLFHVRCPGCGTTRALYSLLHLRFAEAMAYNPFTSVLMIAGAFVGAYSYLHVLWKNDWPALRVLRMVWPAVAVIAFTFFLTRNLGIWVH